MQSPFPTPAAPGETLSWRLRRERSLADAGLQIPVLRVARRMFVVSAAWMWYFVTTEQTQCAGLGPQWWWRGGRGAGVARRNRGGAGDQCEGHALSWQRLWCLPRGHNVTEYQQAPIRTREVYLVVGAQPPV